MFYRITKVSDHLTIKPNILDLIDKFDGNYYITKEEKIAKTDWGMSIDKPYMQHLNRLIKEDMAYTYKQLGGTGISINNIWFHQYMKHDYYDWHNHKETNFTNIYYLEFPDSSPRTEFLDPDTGKVVTIEVEEGYVLTVPGFILHRSPPSNSQRKTVIVFNAELDYQN